MADWNKPTETSDYEDFPDEVRAIAQSAAIMDYASDTNIPESAMRYNRSDKKFYQRESGVWVAKELTNLANDSVGTNQLQNNAVTTTKITDSNVTTAKIADNNVTASKLHADAASRLAMLGQFSYIKLSSGVLSNDPAKFFAGQYATTEYLAVPRNGKVTHMTASLLAPAGSGQSFNIEIYLNGSTTSVSMTFNDAVTIYGAYIIPSPITISIGDGLSVRCDSTSGGNLTAGFEAIIWLWGHFYY